VNGCIEEVLQIGWRKLDDLAKLKACDRFEHLFVVNGILNNIFDHLIGVSDHSNH
jgi:hypothetical protein